MPCVRNLSIGHALQYFDDDIKKKEAKGLDYYSQEDSGIWFGRTAERLGFIDKPFDREDYQNIMKGKFTYFDKDKEKTITVDLTKNSKNGIHHSGIELTLSAPKSVSILAEIFKDKRVIDAHFKAINKTIEYIQDNFIYTRSSVNGVMQLEKVDNLIATKFTHHTNRNHDPQLHTHILIANIAIDKNGKIKTAEHTAIFENERFIRETLYNRELAYNLIGLGYNIDWVKKVTQVAPEINSVPKELLDLFSSRRQGIEKFAEEHQLNLSNPIAMEFACLATRQAKDNSIGIDELSPIWINKTRELGINIDQFKSEQLEKNLQNLEELKNTKTISLTQILKNSIEHLTERQSTFTKEQLITAVVDRSNGLYNVSQIEQSINKNQELVSNELALEQYSKHLKTFNSREKIIYTTKAQIDLENNISSMAENGKNTFKSIKEIENINNKKTNEINELLFGFNKNSSNLYNTLNNNQKQTVDFILNNKDQFLAIQGYAGVGKTYTIKALNEKLKDNNITLVGLAPTHSATNTLKNEANISTNTLQSFLSKYEGYSHNRELNKMSLQNLKEDFSNKIILVDEASLISNKQMKDLLTIASKFNARVILQGDVKQLNSVEAGSPFEYLIKNEVINFDTLDNIQRQKDAELKNTVLDVINNHIVKAFSRFKEYIKNKNNDIENNKELKDKNKNTSKIIEIRTNSELKLGKDLQNKLYSFNEKTNKTEINKDIYNQYLNFLEKNNTDVIKKEIVENVVKEYIKFGKDEKTIIVTSSNELRQEINNKVREHLKEQNNLILETKKNDKLNIDTLEIKQLTSQEKKEIQNYAVGNFIIFNKDNIKLNVKKGEDYLITKISDKEINIKNKNKETTLNISKYSNNLNIYEQTKKELIINERIKINSTNKEFGITKADTILVKDINLIKDVSNNTEINNNNYLITLLNTKTNKEFVLNTKTNNNILKFIDYNYATTTYSSQGKTSNNVILTLESYRPNLTSQKEFYVGLSRTKDNITIITDNLDKSIDSLLTNTGEKLVAKNIETGKQQKIDSLNIHTQKNNDLEFN